MKRTYFDYAASTPVDDHVVKAMKPYFNKHFGNPGSVHWFGQESSSAVFRSRKIIAEALGASYKEIIFTGSATEANNLALRGVFKKIKERYPHRRFSLLTTKMEHSSVWETAKDLERQGLAELVELPVDKYGFVDLKRLKEKLNKQSALVSVIYGNSEIGTVQDIKKIAGIIKQFKEESGGAFPLFHTDAVQAFQFFACKANELGVDLLTLSAHKIYGPKGIGLLYARNLNLLPGEFDYGIAPVITGGKQEWGLRAGTENVPYIVGFGKAVELVEERRSKEAERLAKLSSYLWQKLKKKRPKVKLNGPPIPQNSGQQAKKRLPNNLNIYFPGKSAYELVVELDLKGIAVSPGTACSARFRRPSRIIAALGYKDRPYSSIRITLGLPTTKSDVDRLLKCL